MLSQFHRSGIISGDIDYFCLLCEHTFKTEKNVEDHLQKPVHVRKLEIHPLMEEYPEDCIRKVVNGYYCGLCNILISGAIKVSLHITDESHNTNKKALDDTKPKFLKRIDDQIIAFDKLLIMENAWNSFQENTCLICNKEFNNTDEENVHKWTKEHTLNLITIKVEIINNKALSRKIDNTIFQCLTCHLFYPQNKISSHFLSLEHMDLYKKCCEANVYIDNTNASNSKPKKTGTKTKELKNITAVKTTIENTGDNYDICKKLGIKDYIFCQDSTIICLLCDFVLEANAVDDHVKSTHHLSILKLQTKWIEKKELEVKDKKDSENATFREANETAIKGNIKHKNDENFIQLPKANNKNQSKFIEKKKQEVKENINEVNETANKEKIKDKEIDEKLVKVTKMSTKNQSDHNRDDILNSVYDFQKGDIEIDFTFDKAFCKKCIKVLEFDWDEIVTHIKIHNQNKSTSSSAQSINFNKPLNNASDIKTLFTSPDIKSPGNEVKENTEVKATELQENTDENKGACSSEEDPADYAKLNDITYNKDNSKAYCRTCERKIPNSLHCMKEHVNGSKHKKQLTETQSTKTSLTKSVVFNKCGYKTRTTADFINILWRYARFSKVEYIINNKFCLKQLSFSLCTSLGSRIRCHICDESFDVRQFSLHVNSDTHFKGMLKTPVIVSLDDEFVREVRPGIYHCGFCNFIEGGWDNMQNHLKSQSHRSNKMLHGISIREHVSNINHQELGDFLLLHLLEDLFRIRRFADYDL